MIALANTLSRIKQRLLEKDMLKHWQYLVLASVISFFGAIFWAFLSMVYDVEFGIVAVLIGAIQGLLAYVYMEERGDPRLIFYSLVFSLMSFFLGKYLLFVHYYDWILSGVVDKSDVNFSLLLFYLRVISYDSIGQFVDFFKSNYTSYDILWIVLIVASSLEYLLFYGNQHNDNNPPSQKKSGRRIERRFTGQQF
ncbi:MAG: hypothetical protein DSY76_00530 [Bacteroidetes bacterium]|nr:MAG: hypothetical protein DSY76_00530 [Bacteroidota bacterium]